ncbi:thioredoxin-dependent thiol peroxidase [Candidatus Woesearchaeota archaeon]|nr:thioredoxin-dependent thiol peroxidase [Candidatus Woesearchaeota archaeon]
MSYPAINTKAPAFSLQDQNGKETSLTDFKGKYVVLYFYPKDDTPGCTIEAIDFTKGYEDFKKLNAVILGVSPDDGKSHCKFIDKHKLKITLLSDTEKKTLEAYGVWQEKSMYGRKYMGVARTTFLISLDGKIAFVWEKVSVTGHMDDVKKKLMELEN